VESSLSIAHTVNRETAGRDEQEDGNGKRKAVVGFGEGNSFGNYGIKTSRKKLSLVLPPQSQKKDLCGEEGLTRGVSVACKENKKPNLNEKKLSLGLKQPCNDTLASFRTSAVKSDNNRLSRKLSLRSPVGELNEVSKTEVLAQTDMNQNEDAKSWRGLFENSVLEETSFAESIVVLDSDDSGQDEEERLSSLRSRLSLAKRRVLKCRP